MPYKRRYQRRPRRKPVNVLMRKKAAYARGYVPRSIALKTHHFKQMFHPSAAGVSVDSLSVWYTATGSGAAGSGVIYGPTITSPSAAGYFSIKFTAAQIPQFSSFSALFDTYRINKVVVSFVPMTNTYSTPGNTAGNLDAAPQWLSTVIDYDDSTVASTESELFQYETFKQTPSYRKHVRSLVPACSTLNYKTSGTTIGYSQSRKKWIDCAYDDVEFYGIKGLINGPAQQADQIQCAWKVYVTAYISFKQTR